MQSSYFYVIPVLALLRKSPIITPQNLDVKRLRFSLLPEALISVFEVSWQSL
jgi:hypothetical protein